MRPLGYWALTPLLLLLIVLAVAPTRSWGQQAERIGTVVAIDGTAEARAANATVWEPLQFRAALFPLDSVRTGPESKLKVLLRDDSIITLAERSEMEFTEFLLTPQQRRTVLDLAVGKLRVVTSKIFGSGSGTEVRTANTVAGVRGTTFVVIFIPPSTTEVVGLDGVVTVRHLNPAIPQIEPLQQNFHTKIVGNTAPSPAAMLSTAERQALESELLLVEQVPVEVKPTGQGQSTGSIRGESSEERQIDRSGTPTSGRTAGGEIVPQGNIEPLEILTARTLNVQNNLSPEPPGLQGAPVITPDNISSVTTLQATQPPPTAPQPIQLTIDIPPRR